MQFSDKFHNHFKNIFRDEYDDFISSLDVLRTFGLRVNNLKIDNDSLLNLLQIKNNKVPWTENGFYLQDDLNLSKNPLYFAGLFYLTEPSAMAPASILPVEKNDIVLDMCAAPGGKSMEILNKLQDTGLLISNDISPSRCKALTKNLELTGASNYKVICADNVSLESKFTNYFDKILCDVPCSGEGMMRKDKSIVSKWENYNLQEYQDLQKIILLSAINMLKPGGYLVYSTCTFNTLENEEVISYALKSNNNLELVRTNKFDGVQDGINIDNLDLTNALRFYPHKLKGEGHFVALLHKKNNDYDINDRKINTKSKLSSNALDFLVNKCGLEEKYIQVNNGYYNYNVNNLDLSNIRIVRDGVFLGMDKNNKFVPSQSLSILNLNKFDNRLKLDISDIRIKKYLKCETIEYTENIKDGYVLICIDEYPLGFGIAKNNTIKNKYLPYWKLN